jgi:hypothetical protein
MTIFYNLWVWSWREIFWDQKFMKWQVDWAKELLIGWLIVGLPFLMELILTWWLINPTISFSSFFYNMFQRQIQYRPFFAVLLLFFSFMAILLALHAVLIGQEPYFEQKLSLRDVKVWGRTSLILQLALIVIWIVVYFDYDVSWYEALFGAITLVYPFFMVGLIPLGIIIVIVFVFASVRLVGNGVNGRSK